MVSGRFRPIRSERVDGSRAGSSRPSRRAPESRLQHRRRRGGHSPVFGCPGGCRQRRVRLVAGALRAALCGPTSSGVRRRERCRFGVSAGPGSPVSADDRGGSGCRGYRRTARSAFGQLSTRIRRDPADDCSSGDPQLLVARLVLPVGGRPGHPAALPLIQFSVPRSLFPVPCSPFTDPRAAPTSRTRALRTPRPRGCAGRTRPAGYGGRPSARRHWPTEWRWCSAVDARPAVLR